MNPTAAVAETGRRHLSHTHSIPETAGLTDRPDCTAVLHLALRVLTVTQTTWPGHPTALPGRHATHAAPGRRIARRRDAALSLGLHHALHHTLARHRYPRGVVSMIGFVHALRLAMKAPAPARSDLALRITTTLPPTRTLDDSESTTRKRRRKPTVATETLHAEGQVAPTKADLHTTQETMVDSPAAIRIYLYATSAADSPTTPPPVMQRWDVLTPLLSKRRVPCLHPKYLLHSQLTISLPSRSKPASQVPRRQNKQGTFAIVRASDLLLPRSSRVTISTRSSPLYVY